MAKTDGHTGIALVEGRYWEHTNLSYKGVFDLLSEVHSGSPNDYHYETANSEVAIEEVIPRLATMPNIRYLCLAGHGAVGCISTINNDTIHCTKIAGLVASAPSKIYCDGIHFSTCNTVNQRVAESMLSRLPARKWVSGYRKQIGFIEASALDMLFFEYLINTSRSRPLNVIQEVANRIRTNCEKLVEHLGFGIFIADPTTGSVNDLCRSS